MPKLIVQPGQREIDVEIGDNLLDIAKKHDLGLNHSCDGVPTCATCRVVIVDGGDHLCPIERKEEDLVGTTYWMTKRRLSCQAEIISDGTIEIDIAEHEEFRKRCEERLKNRAEKSQQIAEEKAKAKKESQRRPKASHHKGKRKNFRPNKPPKKD